ncbi:salt stress protein, Slr1339 family [Microcoleus sp. FACHB-672]|uniref:salt stress protein, Slr1339 family n=1 Tax=Microcoleus sp. FACHB-672 TaxID=2692825 RepID=UPI001684F399|nr:hypothetical protein [Microcoleus sp. FACHB-672]MBD2042364.1 hypothetical protein [Microcoleus sp. FACHB-672]
MESIERLLADVKTEYQSSVEPAEPKPLTDLTAKPATASAASENVLLSNFATLPENNLLAELKREYEETNALSSVKAAKVNGLPNLTEEISVFPQLTSSTIHENGLLNNFVSLPENNLLAELKGEYEEEAKAEEQKRQQQLKEEQIRQEKLKQQQREAISKQAQAWLKTLDPLSDEGLWFEEFAYKYPSKQEAAIDYLQALQETP